MKYCNYKKLTKIICLLICFIILISIIYGFFNKKNNAINTISNNFNKSEKNLIPADIKINTPPNYANKLTIDNQTFIYDPAYYRTTKINNIQAYEDIQYLIYVIENAYIGKKYLDQYYYNLLLNNLIYLKDYLLQNKDEKISPDDFFNKIDQIFNLIPDGHLFIEYGYTEDILPEFTKELKQINKYNFLFLKIPSFDSIDINKLNIFIKNLTLEVKQADYTVIDLRGNGGGDENFAKLITSSLLGYTADFGSIYKEEFIYRSSVALAIQSNDYLFTNAQDKALGLTNIINIEKYKKLNNLYDLSLTKPNYAINTYQYNIFNKNIISNINTSNFYILADNNCASSCELMILLLKKLAKNVIIIGKKTSGALSYVDPGLAILPNSKLQVHIPITYSIFRKDIEFIFTEKLGIEPDIKYSTKLTYDKYAQFILKYNQ